MKEVLKPEYFLKRRDKYKIKYQSEYAIKARIEIRTDSNLEIIDKHEDIITSRGKKKTLLLYHLSY